MSASRPAAHGSDRLTVAPDGSLILSCRYPKGWVPRREAGQIHAAFPGTCVRWDEDLFEVIAAEPLSAGFRYTLQRWDDTHVIRVVEDYDGESEKKRVVEREQHRRRASRRWLSLWFAVVVGHLPAKVQQRLENEYGVRACWLTIVSSIPFFVVGTVSMVFFIATIVGAPLGLSIPVLVVGMYFFVESSARFATAFLQSEPMGSLLGAVTWLVWQTLTRRGVSNVPARPQLALDAATIERDAYTIREPLLALLSPAEQTILSERYGFDPVRWGRRTAVGLLLVAIVGLVSSALGGGSEADLGDLLAFLVAGYLLAEQLVRLWNVARGRPSGSVLRVLARPLVKRWLP